MVYDQSNHMPHIELSRSEYQSYLGSMYRDARVVWIWSKNRSENAVHCALHALHIVKHWNVVYVRTR